MENTVLFVDDEVHILKAIKRGLHKETYTKFFASSPQEALEILEKNEIHVIVSDMKMPGMTGLELLTIVKEKYPDVVKIILSGYTQLQQIIVTINQIDIYKFITKPWDMENELQDVINSAIEQYNTRRENRELKVSVVKKNALYQKMLLKNDEKLTLMKNDFTFMESMSQVLIKYYYMMGMQLKSDAITSEEYREELGFLGQLHGEVIKQMPTTHNQFNYRMLQEDLSAFMKKNCPEFKVPNRILLTCKNQGQKFYGDYKIFFYTLTALLLHYFDFENYDTYSLVIDEKKQEEDEEIIEFIVLLKSDSNNTKGNPLRHKSITTFFLNLVKSYNGSLSVDSRKGENLILMRFPMKIVEKKG